MSNGGFPFPEINAGLNCTAALLLTAGFLLIKIRNIRAHRACMVSAFGVSVLFLICYVTYHYQTGARTPFGGEGVWWAVYYAMLVSHVLLAVVIVPLVIRTLLLAVKGNFETHRKWARVTFPLWYYVSVTGVLIYFFLYQWFPVV